MANPFVTFSDGTTEACVETPFFVIRHNDFLYVTLALKEFQIDTNKPMEAQNTDVLDLLNLLLSSAPSQAAAPFSTPGTLLHPAQLK